MSARPALDAVAAARPAGVGARRSVARDRAARPRAEAGRDARTTRAAIGLAHYELGQCYRQVGDIAIVREHITKAASALHAAGDRRHLALVHSLSSISLAQLGRYDEAMTALRQAERLASLVQADDVLATVCGNQANVMMLRAPLRAGARARRAQRRRCTKRTARATASRSRSRRSDRSACGSATSPRAEEALHRALEVRSPIQFHETTGAVFDTLAQIHLIRGRYDAASEFPGPRQRSVRRLRPPDQPAGTSGRCACSAPGSRCGAARSTRRWRAPTRFCAPARRRSTRCRRRSIAAEALTARGPLDRGRAAARRPPPTRSIRASHPPPGASTSGCAARCTHKQRPRRRRVSRLRAERDAARSARRALSGRAQPSRARAAGRRDRRPLGRRAPSRQGVRRLRAARRRARPRRHRAARDAADQGRHRASTSSRPPMPTMRSCGGSSMRRRCRICSGRETAAALLEAGRGDSAVVFVQLAGGDVRVVASAGCDAGRRARARPLGAARPRRTAAARCRRRAARPGCRGPALRAGRLAAADRPSGACGGCG